MKEIRLAIADTGSATREVTPLLPVNYWVLGRTLDNSGTVIAGRDDDNWDLNRVMGELRKVQIMVREQHMIAATPEQKLIDELQTLESITSEMIQDEQEKCEEAMGLEIVDWDGIVYPEDAAPDLDEARDKIRDAIDILNAMEKNA